MPVDVIVGLQWGDEGKGKIAHSLSGKYDACVRYQGGPNAGHTVTHSNHRIVLHTLPAGALTSSCLAIVGAGVFIYPPTLLQEIHTIEEHLNIELKPRLFIDHRAQLILPTHRLLDSLLENARADSPIGTTLRGIAPATADRALRIGIPAREILSPSWEKKFNTLRTLHLRIIEALQPEAREQDLYTLHQEETHWLTSIESLRHLQITCTGTLIHNLLSQNKKILAEGAQGTLLDPLWGTYPFVTSTPTTAGAVCWTLGIPSSKINKIIGVAKAYPTRVGNGPFPTECEPHIQDEIRRRGNEWGSTTGRPRRCGWPDLPALAYACLINGVTEIALTKVDVLASFPFPIKVCISYEAPAPEVLLAIKQANPQYIFLEAWEQPLNRNIHPSLHKFIKTIEQFTRTPVTLLSVGPTPQELLSPHPHTNSDSHI